MTEHTPDDLAKRCQELLEWSKTGLLNRGAGGAVRALAGTLETSGIPESYSLSVAEAQTRDDAMRFVVQHAADHNALVEAAQNLIEEISTRGTHGRWKPLANALHASVGGASRQGERS